MAKILRNQSSSTSVSDSNNHALTYDAISYIRKSYIIISSSGIIIIIKAI